MSLICIAAIKDPIRPEIPRAIEQCKEAGITVRMVTGDNLTTAIAIAKDCGIIDRNEIISPNEYAAMEGKRFRELVGGLVYENPNAKELKDKGKARIKNMDEFKKIAAVTKVIARSTPDDKYLLVSGLIELENVVAVTGDGTNDAPALKKADVGFAMGITGTEVAKEAAAIILLDDNFKSIVTACKWGRNIYDCIRKFIQFQLTINIVALFMSFLGSVVLASSPINSIQMLWVNLIMDTFAALAMATEPPSEELLTRQPYGRTESIVTPNMWRNILGQSFYQITVLTLILFLGSSVLGVKNTGSIPENAKWDPSDYIHYTFFFNTFVYLQIFNSVNCRKLQRHELNIFKNFLNNPFFFVINFIILVLQTVLIYFGGNFFKTAPLTIVQYLLCVAIGAGGLIIGLLIKLLPECLFERIPFLRQKVDKPLVASNRLKKRGTIHLQSRVLTLKTT